ncbi:MAG: ribosome maturation factor RimP [Clostridia bacterium]|nr:ribosome maturation factor RimP [Clostridia bacterium]MDE7079836.1 ribosome maturation factor RimP [Clostridia bacterium]
MSKITDSVKITVEPIIQNLGMELVDVEFKKLYGQDTLIVYIDKDGGVCLDDCEAVHNAIDGPLDELDPTLGKPYNLNVSSPGIDRPLKSARDFNKKIGLEVEVSLFKPLAEIGKIKKFNAKLIGYDEATSIVQLEYKTKPIKLNIKDVALIREAIIF